MTRCPIRSNSVTHFDGVIYHETEGTIVGVSRGCDSKNIRLLVQILPDQETGKMQPESGYYL